MQVRPFCCGHSRVSGRPLTPRSATHVRTNTRRVCVAPPASLRHRGGECMHPVEAKLDSPQTVESDITGQPCSLQHAAGLFISKDYQQRVAFLRSKTD